MKQRPLMGGATPRLVLRSQTERAAESAVRDPAPEARLTIYTIKRPRHIGKIVQDFGEDKPDEEFTMTWGTVGTKTEMRYRTGTYEVVTVDDLEGLADLLEGLEPGREFFTAGVPDTVAGKFVATKKETKHLKKTAKSVPFAEGGGVFVVDCDDKLDPHVVLEMLRNAGIKEVGCVWRPSSSSWLYNQHGTELTGRRGSHFYFLVKDARDIPRAGEVLFKRLWLAGHGHILVSKAGAALERTIYDRAMVTSCQPCFAAGALCLGGVEQRNREAVIFEGAEVMDTKAMLSDLSQDEQHRYETLVAEAKAKVKPACDTARHEHATELITRRLGRTPTGGEVEAAVATLSGMTERQKLDLDFHLLFRDGTVRTVREVLQGGMEYHKAVVADPLEPEYRGAGTLFMNNVPILNSHANMKLKYELGSANERIALLAGAGMDLMKQLMGGDEQ